MAMQPAQASFAHLGLNCQEVIFIKVQRGMIFSLIIFAEGKTPSRPLTTSGLCLMCHLTRSDTDKTH